MIFKVCVCVILVGQLSAALLGGPSKNLAGGVNTVAVTSDHDNIVERVLSSQNSALKNVQIVSVTEQVVSGIRYRMLLEGTENGMKKQCKLDVVSQVWVNSLNVQYFECRDASKVSKRAGEITEEKEINIKHRKIAEDALEGMNADLENIVVKSVKTQVVSGIRYIMEVQATEFGQPVSCHLDIWSQPWLGPPKVNKDLSSCSKVNKRSLLAGGISKEKQINEEHRKIAHDALEGMNTDLKNIVVKSVKTQVVSGVRYIMEVTATEFGEPVSCHLDIWSQPWLGPPKVNKELSSCSKVNKRSLLAGGISEEKQINEEHRKIAHDALEGMNADLKNIVVKSVKTQVVSGVRYIMEVTATEFGQPVSCHLDIWSQPWLGPPKVSKDLSSCNKVAL